MLDIVIKNGILIDGSGQKKYKTDVGIKNNKIKAIGELDNRKAKQIIDANSRYITPGFIDINNHSDTYYQIFANPNLESLVYQGITTIIGGSCGSSLSPLMNTESFKSIRKWVDIRKLNVNWSRLEGLFYRLDNNGLAINFGTLLGHSTIRRGILNNEMRQLSEIEVKAMKKIVKKSLGEGYLGFSTGLAFSHARLASKNELEILVKETAHHKKVYATHLRDESNELLSAIDEAISIADLTGVNLHIFHLKALGDKNWSLFKQALQKISEAQKNNTKITFSIYPYSNTSSVLYTLLPEWVARGGRRMLLRRLQDKKYRQRLISEMKKNSIDYSKMIISISSLDKTLTSKKIKDIAKSQKKGVEETIIDILLINNGRVIVMAEAISEKNIELALKHSASIISSAGVGYNKDYQMTGRLVHPRNFGNFPKVLEKYVKQDKLLSWEEAISKMTDLPAKKFGIKKRGEIKVGNFADILIINPRTISAPADMENPYQYAKGVDYVLVNGKFLIKSGRYTNKKAGQIIKG